MADARFDVLTIGNAIVDVIAPIDPAFIAREGMTEGIMHLIDADRSSYLYELMPEDKRRISGGSAANTAAGVASLGGRAAFVGKVADDDLGEIFAEDLKRLGVHYAVDKLEDAAGGMANLWGVLIVSATLNFLSLRGCFGSYDDALFGVLLIAIVSLAPEGPLRPLAAQARRLWTRLMPRRPAPDAGGATP